MGSKTVEVTIIDVSLSQKIIVHSVSNADNLQLEYLCKAYMGTPNHLRYIIYQVRSALYGYTDPNCKKLYTIAARNCALKFQREIYPHAWRCVQVKYYKQRKHFWLNTVL